jgi:hypothetical protein
MPQYTPIQNNNKKTKSNKRKVANRTSNPKDRQFLFKEVLAGRKSWYEGSGFLCSRSLLISRSEDVKES